MIPLNIMLGREYSSFRGFWLELFRLPQSSTYFKSARCSKGLACCGLVNWRNIAITLTDHRAVIHRELRHSDPLLFFSQCGDSESGDSQ